MIQWGWGNTGIVEERDDKAEKDADEDEVGEIHVLRAGSERDRTPLSSLTQGPSLSRRALFCHMCATPPPLWCPPPALPPLPQVLMEKGHIPPFTRFSWIGDGYSLYSRFSSAFLLKHIQWDLMNAFHRIFHSLHRMLDWEHIGVFSYKPHMCWVLEYVGDRRRHLSSWKSPIWTHKSVRWSIFSHLLLLKIYPQKGWGKPTKIHMFVLPEYTASFVRFSCQHTVLFCVNDPKLCKVSHIGHIGHTRTILEAIFQMKKVYCQVFVQP